MTMNDTCVLAATYLKTPIGVLQIAASDEGLVGVVFPNETKRQYAKSKGTAAAEKHLDVAVRALREYFAGARRDFSDVTLVPSGTDFQMRVWQALYDIPFGETRSYGDIARAIDNPKGVRAVGLANGRNPIPIIVPCHRVIGANGTLTGFGGGLPTKKWLLEHEGISTPRLI